MARLTTSEFRRGQRRLNRIPNAPGSTVTHPAPAPARSAPAAKGVEKRPSKFPTVTSGFASPLSRITNTLGGHEGQPTLPLFGQTEDGATRLSPLERIVVQVARPQLARQRYNKTWKKAAPLYHEAGRKPPKVNMSEGAWKFLDRQKGMGSGGEFTPDAVAPGGERKVILGKTPTYELAATGPHANEQVNRARKLLLHEWRHNVQPMGRLVSVTKAPPASGSSKEDKKRGWRPVAHYEGGLPHDIAEGDAELFARHAAARLYDIPTAYWKPHPYDEYVALTKYAKKKYGPIFQQKWGAQ